MSLTIYNARHTTRGNGIAIVSLLKAHVTNRVAITARGGLNGGDEQSIQV
jgi:hypothetical protein